MSRHDLRIPTLASCSLSSFLCGSYLKKDSISVEIGRICKKRPNRLSVRVVTVEENVAGWIDGSAFPLGFENAADNEEID